MIGCVSVEVLRVYDNRAEELRAELFLEQAADLGVRLSDKGFQFAGGGGQFADAGDGVFQIDRAVRAVRVVRAVRADRAVRAGRVVAGSFPGRFGPLRGAVCGLSGFRRFRCGGRG